jgi:hypothetical protein
MWLRKCVNQAASAKYGRVIFQFSDQAGWGSDVELETNEKY